MLTDIAAIPTDLLNHWPGLDQGLYTSMFLAGRWKIQLDYHNLIFQSWGLVPDPFEAKDRTVSSKNLVENMAKDDQSHLIWGNSCSKRIPAVLHFNADGKSSGLFKLVSKSLVRSIHYNDGGIASTINSSSSDRNTNITNKKHSFDKKCSKFHRVVLS